MAGLPKFGSRWLALLIKINFLKNIFFSKIIQRFLRTGCTLANFFHFCVLPVWITHCDNRSKPLHDLIVWKKVSYTILDNVEVFWVTSNPCEIFFSNLWPCHSILTFSILAIFNFGNFQFWQLQFWQLKFWQLSILAIFNFGNLTTLQFSILQFWQLSILLTFKFGNLQFWQLQFWQLLILGTFNFGSFQF